MAILNKIRQKTVVLILVIALALFAFILSSLFDNKDALFSKSPDVVATINGQDISREEFSNLVEFQQRQMGPNATTSQVMNSVFETKVREAVMNGQIEKLGMTVESEQMRDLIKTSYGTDLRGHHRRSGSSAWRAGEHRSRTNGHPTSGHAGPVRRNGAQWRTCQ